jgi:ankyrin repeat protein
LGGGGRHIWHTRAQDGSTALICAAANGRADCTRLLLDAGADKNTKGYVRGWFFRG